MFEYLFYKHFFTYISEPIFIFLMSFWKMDLITFTVTLDT